MFGGAFDVGIHTITVRTLLLSADLTPSKSSQMAFNLPIRSKQSLIECAFVEEKRAYIATSNTYTLEFWGSLFSDKPMPCHHCTSLHSSSESNTLCQEDAHATQSAILAPPLSQRFTKNKDRNLMRLACALTAAAKID